MYASRATSIGVKENLQLVNDSYYFVNFLRMRRIFWISWAWRVPVPVLFVPSFAKTSFDVSSFRDIDAGFFLFF